MSQDLSTHHTSLDKEVAGMFKDVLSALNGEIDKTESKVHTDIQIEPEITYDKKKVREKAEAIAAEMDSYISEVLETNKAGYDDTKKFVKNYNTLQKMKKNLGLRMSTKKYDQSIKQLEKNQLLKNISNTQSIVSQSGISDREFAAIEKTLRQTAVAAKKSKEVNSYTAALKQRVATDSSKAAKAQLEDAYNEFKKYFGAKGIDANKTAEQMSDAGRKAGIYYAKALTEAIRQGSAGIKQYLVDGLEKNMSAIKADPEQIWSRSDILSGIFQYANTKHNEELMEQSLTHAYESYSKDEQDAINKYVDTLKRKLEKQNMKFNRIEAMNDAMTLLKDFKDKNIQNMMGRFNNGNDASNAMLAALTGMPVNNQKARDAALRSIDTAAYDAIIAQQKKVSDALDDGKTEFQKQWEEFANALIGKDAFDGLDNKELGKVYNELRDSVEEIEKGFLSGKMDGKHFPKRGNKYKNMYLDYLYQQREEIDDYRNVKAGDSDPSGLFEGNTDKKYTEESAQALRDQASAYDALIEKKKEYYGLTKNNKQEEDLAAQIDAINVRIDKEKKKLKELNDQYDKNEEKDRRLKEFDAHAYYGVDPSRPIYDMDKINDASQRLSKFNTELEKRNQFQDKYNELVSIIKDDYISEYGINQNLYKDFDDYAKNHGDLRWLTQLYNQGNIKGIATKDINASFRRIVSDLKYDGGMTARLINNNPRGEGAFGEHGVAKELEEERKRIAEERQRLYDEIQATESVISAWQQKKNDLYFNSGRQRTIDADQSTQESANVTIRSQEEIRKEIEQTNDSIKNQEAWLKHLYTYNKDYTTSGKKAANDQLRKATNRLVNFRTHPEEYEFQQMAEEQIIVDWWKSFQEAKRQGSSDKILSQYETDITEQWFDEAMSKIVKEYEYREKTLHEEQEKLVALQKELGISTDEDTHTTQRSADYEESLDSSTDAYNHCTTRIREYTQAREEANNADKQSSDTTEENTSQTRQNTNETDENSEALERNLTLRERMNKALGEQNGRYLRNQRNSAEEPNYLYTQALNKVMNERVIHSFDPESGEPIVSTSLDINYDKLLKEIIASDREILDLEHQINNASEEEAAPLRENKKIIEDRLGVYERLHKFMVDDDAFAIDEGQDKVLQQQREEARKIFQNQLAAEDAARKQRKADVEAAKAQRKADTEVARQQKELKDEILREDRELLQLERMLGDASWEKDANKNLVSYIENLRKKIALNKKDYKNSASSFQASELDEEIRSQRHKITQGYIIDDERAKQKSKESQAQNKSQASAAAEEEKKVNAALREREVALNKILSIRKQITQKDQDRADDKVEVKQLQEAGAALAKTVKEKEKYLIQAGKQTEVERQNLELQKAVTNQIELQNAQRTQQQVDYDAKQQKLAQQDINSRVGKLGKSNEKLDVWISSGKYSDDLVDRMLNLKKMIADISAHPLKVTNSKDISLLEETEQLLKQIKNDTQVSDFKLASAETISKLNTQIDEYTAKNSAMGMQFRARFDELKRNMDGATTLAQVKQIVAQFQTLKSEVTLAGKTGANFFDTLKQRLIGVNAQLVAQLLSWHDIIRYVRTLAGVVIELDTAMTELRKVSDASTERLKTNMEVSAATAKELGASIKDVINSTADWSRAGFTIDEAEQLARVSTLYQNVGDNLDAATANEYLVSTLRGFHKTADEAERIVDVFNEVANNYSIDTAGIGESLQRSASVFYNASTDLESAVALITGANEIVQDPSRVGNVIAYYKSSYIG